MQPSNQSNKLSTVAYVIAGIVFFTAFGNIFYMKSFKRNLNKVEKSANLVLHPENYLYSGTSHLPKINVIEKYHPLDEEKLKAIRNSVLRNNLKSNRGLIK